MLRFILTHTAEGVRYVQVMSTQLIVLLLATSRREEGSSVAKRVYQDA